MRHCTLYTHLGDADHGARHCLHSVPGDRGGSASSGRGPGGARGQGAGAATRAHSLTHHGVPDMLKFIIHKSLKVIYSKVLLRWGSQGLQYSVTPSFSYLELGRDVLTGRALRGVGGGILAGTSSEK